MEAPKPLTGQQLLALGALLVAGATTARHLKDRAWTKVLLVDAPALAGALASLREAFEGPGEV